LGFLLLLFGNIQWACGADLNGGDDFNDNFKDTAKWGADLAVGSSTLTETQQRLELTTSASGAQSYLIRPWILNTASPTSDWEIVASVMNIANPGLASNQSCSIGLLVMSSVAIGDYVYVGLYASTLGGPPLRRGFVSALGHSMIDLRDADSHNIGALAGAVRMLFNSRTKVITVYFDVGANPEGYAWVSLGSFGVAGSQGTTTNANWDLSGLQPFIVGVYGASSNMNVSIGTVSADNFSPQTAMTSLPSLHASSSGSQLTITWPRAALGYLLQEQGDVDSGVWTGAGSPILINDVNVFRTDFASERKFYRLMRP
jgi:hypothetical protein